MTLFVDTSVWSSALRRDTPAPAKEVGALGQAIEVGETLFTTGLVLQELLQGFSGPKRNHRRRKGVQIGTVDALLAR